MPAFVPAGPDNPMGLYALYIGRLYAIHGTNSNFGIGLRVSQGCIRLRNNDIKYLFDNVSPHARAAYRSACKSDDGARRQPLGGSARTAVA